MNLDLFGRVENRREATAIDPSIILPGIISRVWLRQLDSVRAFEAWRMRSMVV
jgi:hypothetical protein